jgi:hypothetical protein
VQLKSVRKSDNVVSAVDQQLAIAGHQFDSMNSPVVVAIKRYKAFNNHFIKNLE